MSGESQTPAGLVLARLEGMPAFHPADAKLFTDWTLQAGDIVTVENGEESYNLPIQHLDLEWHGSPTVGIGAEGNEKRQPLPELQRRQYAAGQAAEEEAEYFGTQLSRTNSVVEASAWAAGIQIDPDTGLPEVDPETGEYILAPDGSGHDLLGKISVEAGRITQEVTRATGAENALSGRIDVQAGRIDLVVTSSGGTNTVNAGIIVDAINATSGGSIVQIDADHIVLNGTTVASSLVGCDVTFGDCTVNGTLTGQLTGNVEGDLNGSVIGEYHVGYFDQGVFFDGAGNQDARDSVTGFGTASESSGTITIPFYTFNSPSPNAAGNITFNIADTMYYKRGIGSAEQAVAQGMTQSAWTAIQNVSISSTVTATYHDYTTSPATTSTRSIPISVGYPGISSSNASVTPVTAIPSSATSSYTIYPYLGIDGTTYFSNGIQVSTSDLYQAGVTAGVNSVTLGSPTWNPVSSPTPGYTQAITVTASNGEVASQSMQLVAGTGVAYLRSMPSNVTVAQVTVSSGPTYYGDAELGTFDTTTHKASVTVVDASMDPLTEIAVTAGSASGGQVPILVNGHDTGLRVSQSSSYSHSARVDTLIDSGFMMQRQSVDYKLYYLTSNGYAPLITVGSSASNTLCIMSSLMQQSRVVYWP